MRRYFLQYLIALHFLFSFFFPHRAVSDRRGRDFWQGSKCFFLTILDIRHSTFDSGNLLAEACGVVDLEDYNDDGMSRKTRAVLQVFALESVPEAVFTASFSSESD